MPLLSQPLGYSEKVALINLIGAREPAVIFSEDVATELSHAIMVYRITDDARVTHQRLGQLHRTDGAPVDLTRGTALNKGWTHPTDSDINTYLNVVSWIKSNIVAHLDTDLATAISNLNSVLAYYNSVPDRELYGTVPLLTEADSAFTVIYSIKHAAQALNYLAFHPQADASFANCRFILNDTNIEGPALTDMAAEAVPAPAPAPDLQDFVTQLTPAAQAIGMSEATLQSAAAAMVERRYGGDVPNLSNPLEAMLLEAAAAPVATVEAVDIIGEEPAQANYQTE